MAKIGAEKAPVAGVARPLEVVLVAAVLADRCRRRVHQPHVLDLELADQRELEPAVEVVDVAAQATGGFAFGDQRLAARVEGVVARLADEGIGGTAGREGGCRSGGDWG